MGKHIARKIYLLPVRAYQKFISPLFGKRCIYSPTCSAYFYKAVMELGIIRGTILGICRIVRCNRLFYGGPDDIPQKFSWRHIRDTYVAFQRHGKALL